MLVVVDDLLIVVHRWVVNLSKSFFNGQVKGIMSSG